MWACRVAVLAGVALASASDAAAERHVGFAVLAGSEPAPVATAIARVRADLPSLGFTAMPPGALRDALEGPLSDSGEAAVLARVRELTDRAKEAYAGFEYERALAELEAIDRVLLDREPTPTTVELLAERHLLAGVVHEGRGRQTDARRAFQLVHHLDPQLRSLDSGTYRPQVVKLFAQALAADDRRVSLRVTSEPDGARVWLDGRAIGEAPLELRLASSGAHWVVASAPGHRTRGRLVELDPAEPQSQLTLALKARAPAENAIALRRALSASGEREQRAAELARAAGVDVLVLVRTRGGQVEGAAIDPRHPNGLTWLAMPSAPFSRQLAAPPAAAGASGSELVLPAVSADSADRSPSWYGTWWGRTLLVAGGLAATGAVIYAVTAGDDPGYVVGDFCFEGRDC
jgi:hypothetical protein